MNTVNWFGCALLLAGYVVLTLRNPTHGLRAWGIATSGMGTAMVGLWAWSVHAWPILIMESIFTAVSFVQFRRLTRSKP